MSPSGVDLVNWTPAITRSWGIGDRVPDVMVKEWRKAVANADIRAASGYWMLGGVAVDGVCEEFYPDSFSSTVETWTTDDTDDTDLSSLPSDGSYIRNGSGISN